MDNLSAHKVKGVKERIEAAGAKLRSLPPYSPDFNPTEPCWLLSPRLSPSSHLKCMRTTNPSLPSSSAVC